METDIEMNTAQPETIQRLDYTVPSFLVDHIDLTFDLAPSATSVSATTRFKHNPASDSREIVLNGQDLELVKIVMNGRTLEKPDYALDHGELRIPNAPDDVTLVIDTLVRPDKNTSLMGLYISNGNLDVYKRQDQGFSKTVSVNLSSIQLKQKDLLGTIKNALEENDLTPDFLELQITEGSITENIRTVIDLLNELRNMGVKIALDNFGNGCSSISHLKRVPIEKIKIDPSFIRALGTQSSDADVAGAIIAMAKNLNLKVSAGGVETTDQANRLKEIGCDEYQGYVISPTLPAKEINRLQLPN